MSNNESNSAPAMDPRLGLWDAVSIIIGIVVGTAIFRSPSIVFANSPGPAVAILLWLIGGVLSWCGAVCYAELATTYPRDGGDYVYLSRAFGQWCGFLFGWAQLTSVLSGNIAIMAYAFADYAVRLNGDWNAYAILLTIGPVVVLSAVNAVGVVVGKWTQNLLTVAKLIGIAGVAAAGLLASDASPQPVVEASPNANIGLALVFVLYAYGGWNHTAYVAAEVRDQRRNLPRALFIGLACIVIIYVAVNLTYVSVLGFAGAQNTSTPATDVMELAVGAWGGKVISVIVMLSALSAINGMILTGTRIYAAWGADHPRLAWLGAWNERSEAPVAAITLQCAVAVALIALVGTDIGRSAFDGVLGTLGLTGLPWEKYSGGFEMLVAGSAPVYWGLCLMTCAAVFVLRCADRTRERPFRIPLYPLPVIVFSLSCIYMLQSSVLYAKWLVLLSVIPLGLGFAAWLVLGHRHAADVE
jgi:amino acid transporter